MKMRLYVLCGCLMLAWPKAFAEQQTVTFGLLLFPPNSYIDKSTGKCVGNNLVKTGNILAHYNIKLEVVCAVPIRMYRLVENSKVDFTVNIKSTRALNPHVEFVDTPYTQLVLNLYSYSNINKINTVSAIRGFDYNGYRQKYLDEGLEFIDLPTAVSAIQVFLKQRSEALISYQSNVAYLQRNNAMVFPEEVTVTPLLKVDTHYAIAKGSAHFDLLWQSLNDYALKREIRYFMPQPAPSSP